MGILEFVNNEHAGIIPRAISQIFDYVDGVTSTTTSDITIGMSFLQLYRETIQDLLSPASGSQVADDNLAIREDPQRLIYPSHFIIAVTTKFIDWNSLFCFD